jgi:hypothetical protein
MIIPPAGSKKGDSGSCVTIETTDETIEVVKIHSFLKGKMNNLNYRLLSPAHFVLEQIRKITKNPDAVFVSLLLPPSLIQKPNDTPQLVESINNIGSQFNRGRRNLLLRQQNNVESSNTDTDDETNHSNVNSSHTNDETNSIYKCNCS